MSPSAASLGSEIGFWPFGSSSRSPAWVDVTNGSTAPLVAPSGFQAGIGLVQSRFHAETPPPPQITDADDYYSASVILLVGLARQAVGL